MRRIELRRFAELERVAVVRLCRGDESKIEREHVALRQYGLEPERAQVQIKPYLFRLPLGVSITARTSPVSGSSTGSFEKFPPADFRIELLL
jgi:hypothetical protein